MIKLQSLYPLLARLNKREKTILYAAAAVLLLVLFDRLIAYPIYSKINSLNNEIREKEKAIARDLRIYGMKDKIQEEAKKYETFWKGADTEEEEVTLILKEIENIASKGSLYIVEMKPAGVKEDKNNNKKFVVNLTCEAQMEQLMAFMYSIENSSMLLSVDKYQISPKTRESSIVQCSMTISKVVVGSL